MSIAQAGTSLLRPHRPDARSQPQNATESQDSREGQAHMQDHPREPIKSGKYT
ncbi:hypothetical protein BZG36_02790 [Bifiguratus adelaidae]|uniref:Uncharacterized protein n=1 Tax=Bifiguratus adelaidae TaxID=1938954 RepID=A0A261Y1G0_9FUNG|nr:hypothetical protein BZG36_02790 [Bifiguratus adelaidae]